eukprot:6207573-Pleurochrysis_carterae.AAC.1
MLSPPVNEHAAHAREVFCYPVRRMRGADHGHLSRCDICAAASPFGCAKLPRIRAALTARLRARKDEISALQKDLRQ